MASAWGNSWGNAWGNAWGQRQSQDFDAAALQANLYYKQRLEEDRDILELAGMIMASGILNQYRR